MKYIDKVLSKETLSDEMFSKGVRLKYRLFLWKGEEQLGWQYLWEQEKTSRGSVIREIRIDYLWARFRQSFYSYQRESVVIESEILQYKEELPFEIAQLAIQLLDLDIHSHKFE